MDVAHAESRTPVNSQFRFSRARARVVARGGTTMPTEAILNGSCRQHDFGTPPEPALTALHQAISRVCWFVAFLHVTFVQKIWTAQNFGFFCRALTDKSALETRGPEAAAAGRTEGAPALAGATRGGHGGRVF